MKRNRLVAGCVLAALTIAAVATFVGPRLDRGWQWLDERFVGQSLDALSATWGEPYSTGECALDEVPTARMRAQITQRTGGDAKVVRWASWEGWTAETTVWFAPKDGAWVAVTGRILGNDWIE